MEYKTRLIFAYYVNTNDLDNIIYKYHLYYINEEIDLFNYVDIYLCIDDISNIELIDNIKQFILSNLNNVNSQHTYINFYIIENNQYYREGLIYYKYFINELSSYANNNELVLFAHTKGLTNNNLNNTLDWIGLLYYFNLRLFWYPKYKLTDDEFNTIAYGALYNYSLRNLSKYKWIYYGGFSWVNSVRLNNYIVQNNISFNKSRLQNIRTCAEDWLPNILNVDKICFYECERYNMYNDSIKYEPGNLPYNNIIQVAIQKMHTEQYIDYINSYKVKL